MPAMHWGGNVSCYRWILPRIVLVISVGAVEPMAAAPVGAASPRRMLMLHGSGASAGSFVNSDTKYGGKEFIEGIPRRTDAGSVAPPNWLYEALDANSGNGEWWQDGDALTGIEASIAAVENEICNFNAAGLVGHEQGATLAAIVAARSMLGEGPPLKFAVLCNAELPSTGPFLELFLKLKDAPERKILPTLHCIGGEREANQKSVELAACFGSAAETLWHSRDGAMPDRNW